MAKQLIRLTESDLHRIIEESVNRVLNEGFMDSLKGAAQGWKQGANTVKANGSALHQTSSIVYDACNYFGQIMRCLSKNDVAGAQQLCKTAYETCKNSFNQTANINGNTITQQYGAHSPKTYQQQ